MATENTDYSDNDNLRWHLDVRLFRPLARAGIRTISDLRDRMDDVRHGDIRGIGEIRIAELDKFLTTLA